MTCSNCGKAMTEQALAAHFGATVTVDVCLECHLFWFDAKESVQLTPASTLRLFRMIGEESSRERVPLRPKLKCPRCDLSLKLVHDMQRTTKFQVQAVPA